MLNINVEAILLNYTIQWLENYEFLNYKKVHQRPVRSKNLGSVLARSNHYLIKVLKQR